MPKGRKSDREKALEEHQDRSFRARVADESFRSTKVTNDFETWKSDPSQYDFKGVDTISPEYKQQRARQAVQTAKEKGLVDEFVSAESKDDLPGSDKGATDVRTRGTFEPGEKPKVGIRVDKQSKEEQAETIAHEVGHAIDHGEASAPASSMQGLGLGELDPITVGEQSLDTVGAPAPDDGVGEEVKGISEERRGEITQSNREYRENPTELFADFFGSAITRPRNTKAKASETRERVGEVFEEAGGKDPSKQFADEFFSDDFF